MPMARIPWNDLIWAKKALDAGATGLVIPRVETAEMALQINLKTAQALGLDIPDEFIHQAQQIVR